MHTEPNRKGRSLKTNGKIAFFQFKLNKKNRLS